MHRCRLAERDGSSYAEDLRHINYRLAERKGR